MRDKQGWPHASDEPVLPLTLPPRPGVHWPPVGARAYTTCCPHCTGVHLAKADFMACRAGHIGY